MQNDEVYITIPSRLFPDSPISRSGKAINKRRIPHYVDNKEISILKDKWKAINELFLTHYPKGKEIRPIDSSFCTKKEQETMAWLNSLSREQWDEEACRIEKQAYTTIRDTPNPPLGYTEFLNDIDHLSEKLDQMVINNLDFWDWLPFVEPNYWTEYNDKIYKEAILLYNNAVLLIYNYLDNDSTKKADKIKSINIQFNESLNGDVKSKLILKKRKAKKRKANKPTEIKGVKYDNVLSPLFIDGILTATQEWFDELEIPINIYKTSPDDAQQAIKAHLLAKTGLIKDNPKAFITLNLIRILVGSDSTPGSLTNGSAIFIARFLRIVGYVLRDTQDSTDLIEELDNTLAAAKEDRSVSKHVNDIKREIAKKVYGFIREHKDKGGT